MNNSKSKIGTSTKFLELYDSLEVESTYIKSIRLGKVEEAIYWLEVMLQSDSTPVNIAKMLLIESQESGLGISPAVYAETIFNIQTYTNGNVLEALFQLTVYLCTCKKWWEDEIMREYFRTWISIKKDVEKVGKRIHPPKQIPKYALDNHTRKGKLRASMGESIDDRFSGTEEGMLYMSKLYEKYGRLHEDDHLSDKEKSEIKSFVRR